MDDYDIICGIMKGLNRIIGQRAITLACSVLLLNAVYGDMGDRVLRFSTQGPDRYADGSVVIDGECYALVWSPAGKTFSGFNADGTPVSANDCVVLAAPLALGGKCRDVFFQIPSAEYALLEGGEWAVCLVDTRNLAGVPTGVQDNRPVRVNRWGAVDSGVKLEPADANKLEMAKSGKARPGAAGGSADAQSSQGSAVRANRLSAVPADLAPPQITAIDIGEGEVWLAVDGTTPYLDYTIVSGETPNNLKTDYFSEVVEGDDSGEIAIGTVKSVKRRFFKVVRAE